VNEIIFFCKISFLQPNNQRYSCFYVAYFGLKSETMYLGLYLGQGKKKLLAARQKKQLLAGQKKTTINRTKKHNYWQGKNRSAAPALPKLFFYLFLCACGFSNPQLQYLRV
jgi:hypothetical protein